jgi:hypothetical protein
LKLISSSALSKIEADGAADVRIGEHAFKISRQFVEDVRGEKLAYDIGTLRKPLLIMHAPRDEIVGIENATEIFLAAKHPKSFISLDAADHLLFGPADAEFASRQQVPGASDASVLVRRVHVGGRVQGTDGRPKPEPCSRARWQHVRSQRLTEDGVSVDKHVDAEATVQSARVGQHSHVGVAERVRLVPPITCGSAVIAE